MRKLIIVLGVMLYFISPANQYELIPEDKSFTATVSAYTCGVESTGKLPNHLDYCKTASGHILKDHDAFVKVAADNTYYRFGTKIYIDGIGEVEVVDTGGDIKGYNRFDLYTGEDVQVALNFGVKELKITRLE